jgi:hypothetical protein
MRPRLARSPCLGGELGRPLDAETVGIAAVMVDVVDERDAEPLAQWQ